MCTRSAVSPASLEAAAEKLGAKSAGSLAFSGAGQWFQFGQAPVPGGPWPQFDVSLYSAAIDSDGPISASNTPPGEAG